MHLNNLHLPRTGRQVILPSLHVVTLETPSYIYIHYKIGGGAKGGGKIFGGSEIKGHNKLFLQINIITVDDKLRKDVRDLKNFEGIFQCSDHFTALARKRI